jgi:hypothetical protein
LRAMRMLARVRGLARRLSVLQPGRIHLELEYESSSWPLLGRCNLVRVIHLQDPCDSTRRSEEQTAEPWLQEERSK